ncbi:MAG TPA: arginine deiminase family protein [Candidatus Eisenbacteria bacterium]
MIVRHAIVRPPGESFCEGLTSSGLGPPDLALAKAQHQAYCEALLECGVALTWLPADPRYPDSTFVEDTAVLTPRGAVLTRPGAESRRGEVDEIRPALEPFYQNPRLIESPGTLDGGDVCEAGDHVFIGISERTNEAGAGQLASFLAKEGYATATVDIRGIPGILHLKSGVAALDDWRLAVAPDLLSHPAFRSHRIVAVAPEESYAANCVNVNDRILIASGYPEFTEALRRLGYDAVPLEMSEFRKMDGGLSCLSLRF